MVEVVRRARAATLGVGRPHGQGVDGQPVVRVALMSGVVVLTDGDRVASPMPAGRVTVW